MRCKNCGHDETMHIIQRTPLGWKRIIGKVVVKSPCVEFGCNCILFEPELKEAKKK